MQTITKYSEGFKRAAFLSSWGAKDRSPEDDHELHTNFGVLLAYISMMNILGETRIPSRAYKPLSNSVNFLVDGIDGNKVKVAHGCSFKIVIDVGFRIRHRLITVKVRYFSKNARKHFFTLKGAVQPQGIRMLTIA
jgi:hypothetical protein